MLYGLVSYWPCVRFTGTPTNGLNGPRQGDEHPAYARHVADYYAYDYAGWDGQNFRGGEAIVTDKHT